jgi:hypothetical protein
MKRIWEMYPLLTRSIKKSHDAMPSPMLYCHDFDHIIRVADRATVIAPDPKTGRLAAVAGLCHNADRILQKKAASGRDGKVSDELVTTMTNDWLDAEPVGTFPKEDRVLILDAVLNHWRRNSPDDSLVLMTLQDADRTVNIEADVIVRKGGYWGDDLRVVDPVNLLDDPKANFKNPGSVLWTMKDEEECFMAENGVANLRLPKARELARTRFAFYHQFFDAVIGQREEAGLIPYPVFD